jgi:putative nucleotidyltransferase with HDIG domain
MINNYEITDKCSENSSIDISKRSLLCVDDDKTILNAFERDLMGINIKLSLAHSAEEGLRKLEKEQFALVLTDLRMPGTDGITFLQKVAKKSPDTVRMLISGRADFSSAVDAINKAGLFSFIAKPWNTETLKETIESALAHYDILKENKRLTSALSEKCAELGFLTINLEKEVQARTTSMLLGMVNALDLRDTETHWHSKRVALYSHKLAEKLAISDKEMLDIERGALLHDVGKIGVSDTILLKPGKLTPQEWQEMRRHADYGYQIIKNIDFLGNARKLVWQHHERWDGKGYPKGLAGKDIYIGARIFAIIDTYDAITSDRPYRKAQSHQVACAEIEKMAGTQFDPEIVKIWAQIPEHELSELRDLAFTPTAGLS